MFLGRKAALILATVWLTTNVLTIQANFVTDYLAHGAYQKQDFVTAEGYYQTQVRSDYTDSTALYNLGAAAYQNKNYTEARKCFEQVGATEALTTKKRAEAYFNAGNSSVQLNELEKALEQYKTALKFDPNDQRIKDNYEKLKKILEQQQQDNPEKNKPDNKPDQDSQEQKSKDNSGDSKDSQDQSGDQQDQQKNSGPDQKSKEQAAKDNSGQDQGSKNQAPKDQLGDQQNNQAPKNNPDQKSGDQKPKASTGSEHKNSAEQKPTPADNSGEQNSSSGQAQQVPVSSSGPDQQAKLDPELKELMQAAQASDRAVNKQIMQYQMNQSGDKNSAEQGNNW